MLAEANQVKRFFGIKFGYGETLLDGVYAVPTKTSKGNAFMKISLKDGKPSSKDNFSLFWYEQLTTSWYDQPKPENLVESKFSELFRQIEELRD